MVHSVEAIIQTDGQVVLDTKITLSYAHRAIVTILDEPDITGISLMSEKALAMDWDRPEEDAAWAHLQ